MKWTFLSLVQIIIHRILGEKKIVCSPGRCQVIIENFLKCCIHECAYRKFKSLLYHRHHHHHPKSLLLKSNKRKMRKKNTYHKYIHIETNRQHIHRQRQRMNGTTQRERKRTRMRVQNKSTQFLLKIEPSRNSNE